MKTHWSLIVTVASTNEIKAPHYKWLMVVSWNVFDMRESLFVDVVVNVKVIHLHLKGNFASEAQMYNVM
jgi:hypothetical protein